MKIPRSLFIVAALGLSLLLAACSQPGSDARTPAPDGFITVSVGLDSSSLNSQNADEGLTTLGVPFDSAGDIAVKAVRVQVSNKDGTVITFSMSGDDYQYDPDGDEEYILLVPAADVSKTIELPAAGSPYAFESRGYAEDDGNVTGTSEVLAYDNLTSVTFAEGASVWIALKSVIRSATVSPRFTTNMVTPGQTLDLMLNVYADSAGTLRVPMNDFYMKNDPTFTNATLLDSSKRGFRLEVDSLCTGELEITGAVRGLTTSLALGDVGIAASGSLECPSSINGLMAGDLENPTVSIASYDRSSGAIVIVATDNFGIASVRVFDGPAVVASTIASEFAENGVAEITYTGSNDQYTATLATGSRGLQAIATDHSGNQAETDEGYEVDRSNVYVVENGTGDEDGSSVTHAFATIQDAVDVVADGGTVHIAEGTYLGFRIYRQEGITIIGTGVNPSKVTISGPGRDNGAHDITVSILGSNNVTLDNFTVIGVDSSTGTHAPSAVYGERAIQVNGNPSSTSAVTGLTIRNVVVDGFGETGIGLTVTRGSLLENVTVRNGTHAKGITLKASEDITLNDVTTENNLVGLSIETAKNSSDTYYIKSVTNVKVAGANGFTSVGDIAAVMTGIYDDQSIDLSSDQPLDLSTFGEYRYTDGRTLNVLAGCGQPSAPFTYYVPSGGIDALETALCQ